MSRLQELSAHLVALDRSLERLEVGLRASLPGPQAASCGPRFPADGRLSKVDAELRLTASASAKDARRSRLLVAVLLFPILFGASLVGTDAFAWAGSATGYFSARSGYWLIPTPESPNPLPDLCAEHGLTFTTANTVTGTAGPDFLVLGNQGQLALALGGFDVVVGGNGRDCIDGGPGGDILKGLNGDDVILGGEGNDFLYGGAGEDVLDGGPGFDICVGGSGKDTIRNCEVVFQGIDPGGCEPVNGAESLGANTDRNDDDCDPGCNIRHTEDFSGGDANHHDRGDGCADDKSSDSPGVHNFAAPVDDGSTDDKDATETGQDKDADDLGDGRSGETGDGEEPGATVVKDGATPSDSSAHTGGTDPETKESDDSETPTPEPEATPTPRHAPKPTLQPGMREVISTAGGVAIYPK